MKTLRDILNEQAEQIDELSGSTLKSYIKKAGRVAANADDSAEHLKGLGDKWQGKMPKNGAYAASEKYAAKSEKRLAGIVTAAKKLTKEDVEEIEEARHKKDEGGEDSEANQNIITQLRKAHASMEGGSKVYFKDGTNHFVSGNHASKLLDKHADMKPVAKAAFQAKIHKSHDALKSEV